MTNDGRDMKRSGRMQNLATDINEREHIKEAAGTATGLERREVQDTRVVVDRFFDLACRGVGRVEADSERSHRAAATQIQIGHEGGDQIEAVAAGSSCSARPNIDMDGGGARNLDGFCHVVAVTESDLSRGVDEVVHLYRRLIGRI